ncbi:fatty acid desaturase family protein [Roseateles sp.]|uniref:fatty acid desaturase family protein n=1 Tax=Roseateles sp. TaxID=1971397 RepID=UPI003BA85954
MDKQVDMRRVQELVADLRDPRPGIFYTDLLLSAGLGWACFAGAMQPGPAWVRGLAFVAAVLLLYRSLAFIHEIFHQQGMNGFRRTWHALSGVPLLIPFLLYLPIHQGHHNKQVYGTAGDGEYDQFHGRAGAAIAKLFVLNVFLPLALWVRFALLTPLAAVLPPIREKMIPEFVHMALRMPFRAPAIKESARAEAMRIEWWCCAWAWALVAVGVFAGWAWVGAWALLVIAIATLNTIRALGGTHLYVEAAEGRDARGQLLDSLNVDSNGLVAVLLCPVGLRFHALHHVAPYLPYHAMPTAHRRLMAQLPAGSEYHQVTVKSLGEGIARLREATRAVSPPAETA